MKRLGGDAVPFMALLDGAGELIAPYRGPHTVEGFQRARRFAEGFARLRALEAPSLAERVELLLCEVELERVAGAAARARLAARAGVSAGDAARVERAIANVEVLRLWYETQPTTRPARAKLGERYLTLLEAGCRPDRKEAAQPFYLLICEYAEQAGDAAAYAKSLDGLRAWLEDQGLSTQALAPFEARLEQLRER